MIKKLKIIVILLLVFSLLVYIFYRNSIYKGADINTSISEFSISKGEGVSSIVNRLFEENLISSKLYLRYYLWEKKLDKKIQSGKYQLSKNLSPAEIIAIFVRGDVIENEKNVKIIEGWNLLDIAENFEKNNISSSKDFLSLTEAPVSSWVFEF
ncbi:hypothetical protein C0584_01075 [Candidatus Parcubacteria bacterium]|nr:MAG: hypothetical protein C0584_01075 [Candidatus Parcubacteria bacterium]